MEKTDLITQALQSGVDDEVFPGAVLLVRRHGHICYDQAVGLTSFLSSQTVTSLDTIYDLASLTKPLVTGTGVLCLVQDALVDLDQPIDSIVIELKKRAIGQATIRDLLCHRSGLPGWRPYYETILLQNGVWPNEIGREIRRKHVLEYLAQEPFEYEPRTKGVYSDLGYILLGLAIESVTQQSLNHYCAKRIFNPLNAEPLSYFENTVQCSDSGQSLSDISVTEQDSWRGRFLQGEVHDENAYALGGVAGHAGLFGTAEAVSVVTNAWLDAYLDRSTFLDPQLVREFTAGQGVPGGSSWVLGWDTPSNPSSSGAHFSHSAFGHLGFTGTSIWIDPEVELEVILLTNRVHPTRENNKIRQFRPMIHDVVYEELVRIK